MENEIDKLGRLVDRCENLIAAGTIPGMPKDITAAALSEALPEIRDEIRDVYFALGGDKDTWR